jgi:hypothetical protein
MKIVVCSVAKANLMQTTMVCNKVAGCVQELAWVREEFMACGHRV